MHNFQMRTQRVLTMNANRNRQKTPGGSTQSPQQQRRVATLLKPHSLAVRPAAAVVAVLMTAATTETSRTDEGSPRSPRKSQSQERRRRVGRRRSHVAAGAGEPEKNMTPIHHLPLRRLPLHHLPHRTAAGAPNARTTGAGGAIVPHRPRVHHQRPRAAAVAVAQRGQGEGDSGGRGSRAILTSSQCRRRQSSNCSSFSCTTE